MIVERSMDPRWLSNAYVVGDELGGVCVFVDSGAPLGPLLEAVERERLTPTHVLRTHSHPDHVEHEAELTSRFGIPVVTGALETGRLRVEAIATPGHSDDGVAFLVDGEACFSGDTLFRDAVGGGPADEVRYSVMERLMTLPPEIRVLPGHTVETTIGREWERNPFVRFWRGLDGEDGGRCRLGGEEGTVLVTSPDYDGKGKLLVRFDIGDERIVGASRVELL
jgi:hydroxyacylglutathione hydrolase